MSFWYFDIINYKKPSLYQGISRSSFTIPTYRFLSYSSSLLPSFFWYCPDNKISCYKIYLSKLNPRHALHRSRRYIHFLILLYFQVLYESIASAEIKKIHLHCYPTSIYRFWSSQPSKSLVLYKQNLRFSISMPFRLFAFLSNLTFGTYNDVTGNQTNTYNGKYCNSYNLSSLANEWY